MNEYGLVISEPGYDADTCPPENTIFDTRFDTPKSMVSESLVTVGRITFQFNVTPAVGTRRIKTINHNFGYIPLLFAFYDRNGSSTNFSQSFGFTTGEIWLYTGNLTQGLRIVIKATATQITFDVIRDSGSTPNMVGKVVTVNYYIFSVDSTL